MYEITSNQKEQLLNQVLNALTNATAATAERDRQLLLLMYEKIQRLRLGESVSLEDALRLKSLIKKVTSKQRRPCPNKGKACASKDYK